MPGDGLGDGITSAEGRLLAVQMGALRDDIREIKETMRSMSRSLEQLVRLEEQQKDMRSAINRSFDEIKVEREKREILDNRVSEIERVIPGLGEMRGWVITGVIGSLGILASAVVVWFFGIHVH